MADNYLTWFKSSLKSMYPTMSDSDAESLGWGGLQETWKWNNLLSTNIKNNILETNVKYRDGILGNKCP